MAESGALDHLTKLIHDLNFEIQLLKQEDDKEKQLISGMESHLKEVDEEMKAAKAKTIADLEQADMLEKQYQQNMQNCDSLRETMFIQSQQERSLSEKLEQLKAKGQANRERYRSHVELYKGRYSEYESVYKQRPLYVELTQKQEQLRELREREKELKDRTEELAGQREDNKCSKQAKSSRRASFEETKKLIVKLAEVKVETMKYEREYEKLVRRNREHEERQLQQKSQRKNESGAHPENMNTDQQQLLPQQLQSQSQQLQPQHLQQKLMPQLPLQQQLPPHQLMSHQLQQQQLPELQQQRLEKQNVQPQPKNPQEEQPQHLLQENVQLSPDQSNTESNNNKCSRGSKEHVNQALSLVSTTEVTTSESSDIASPVLNPSGSRSYGPGTPVPTSASASNYRSYSFQSPTSSPPDPIKAVDKSATSEETEEFKRPLGLPPTSRFHTEFLGSKHPTVECTESERDPTCSSRADWSESERDPTCSSRADWSESERDLACSSRADWSESKRDPSRSSCGDVNIGDRRSAGDMGLVSAEGDDDNGLESEPMDSVSQPVSYSMVGLDDKLQQQQQVQLYQQKLQQLEGQGTCMLELKQKQQEELKQHPNEFSQHRQQKQCEQQQRSSKQHELEQQQRSSKQHELEQKQCEQQQRSSKQHELEQKQRSSKQHELEQKQRSSKQHELEQKKGNSTQQQLEQKQCDKNSEELQQRDEHEREDELRELLEHEPMREGRSADVVSLMRSYYRLDEQQLETRLVQLSMEREKLESAEEKEEEEAQVMSEVGQENRLQNPQDMDVVDTRPDVSPYEDETECTDNRLVISGKGTAALNESMADKAAGDSSNSCEEQDKPAASDSRRSMEESAAAAAIGPGGDFIDISSCVEQQKFETAASGPAAVVEEIKSQESEMYYDAVEALSSPTSKSTSQSTLPILDMSDTCGKTGGFSGDKTSVLSSGRDTPATPATPVFDEDLAKLLASNSPEIPNFKPQWMFDRSSVNNHSPLSYRKLSERSSLFQSGFGGSSMLTQNKTEGSSGEASSLFSLTGVEEISNEVSVTTSDSSRGLSLFHFGRDLMDDGDSPDKSSKSNQPSESSLLFSFGSSAMESDQEELASTSGANNFLFFGSGSNDEDNAGSASFKFF